MAILDSEAVVLRGWKLGETSKIVSFYTKEFGKVRAVAKGGRGPKSKFRGCLEPLTHLRIIFYEKKSRDLQLLSKTDLIDPHYRIIGNETKSALGLAAVELIDRAVVGEEPFPRVFDLLASVLRGIDAGDGFLEANLWFFMGHFIALMGYKPTWDACLECGNSLGMEGGYFLPQNGGLLCDGCGGTHGGFAVGGETLEIMYWLQQGALKDVGRIDPTERQKAEIRKMFELYFRTHIDHMRNLRALELYYRLEMKE